MHAESFLTGFSLSLCLSLSLSLPLCCLQSGEEETTQTEVYLGKIPIMLRSRFCALRGKNNRDFYELNECPLDPGGYFIIKGSEKVLLAQEKMAPNTVFVFEKKDIKYLFVTEIKSVIERSSRPPR